MPTSISPTQQLIREKYHGIRPAPGYPACPDHSLKPMLFEMLGGNPGEVTLTENFAMLPTSAVSGFYFGHRDSQYFGVARIGRDQLEDYAERRGVVVEQARALAAAESRLERIGSRALAQRCDASPAADPSRSCCSLPPLRRRAGIEPELVAEGPGAGWRRGRARDPHAASPGWHGYWLNPGDAGLPMDVQWQLPTGFCRRAAALPGADAARPSRA